MAILDRIRETVQQFAEAANAVLKLDVEVFNDELVRIAGAGETAGQLVDKKIVKEGVINRFLFSTHRRIIIDHPGKQLECSLCPRYGDCIYHKAVYSTIEHEGRPIGVIGLSAMNEEQAALVKENIQDMLEFIDKIAGLISTKVQEYENLGRVKTYAALMDTVIDSIDKGVITVNEQSVIVDINTYMAEKLDIDKNQVRDRHITTILPNIALQRDKRCQHSNEYMEYSIVVNNNQRYFLYCVKIISVSNDLKGAVYIFEDFKDTSDMTYNLSRKENTILLSDIIGEDPSFKKFKSRVKTVSDNDSTVLLIGETGVGKELFARAIHSESSRKDSPFVVVNCGAIPESLIESEFFGYEKGAFTGASSTGKHGKFFMADKGTLFLDEIEAMPLYLQPRLLRAIERKEIERVGGTQSIPVDVRIVAAANVRLDEMVKAGQFRQDLFHRLNVVTLFIPPLRERGDDYKVLIEYFIEKYSAKFNKDVRGLSKEAYERLKHHHWKGNVRELQNTIEYAVNMETSQEISIDNLPFQFRENQARERFLSLEELERNQIVEALKLTGWGDEDRIKASEMLGISRATIYRKIKKYGITLEDISS